MSYRPLTDVMILARSKVKYYGAYPAGSLIRMRDLLGVGYYDPVLHVCSGRVQDYPYRGFGPNDFTLDIDGDVEPDFMQDARDPFPEFIGSLGYCIVDRPNSKAIVDISGWPAILCDPPYTEEDADKYASGRKVLPSARRLLLNGLDAVRVGGKVGILHYVAPRMPKGSARFVGCFPVFVGFENRPRLYSVYERLK